MSEKALKISLGGKSIHLSEADFVDAKKSFYNPESEEGKKIEMAMTVDATADYATNAEEYYRKALIGEDKSRGKFRQVLGIKDRVKLGTADVSAIDIKPYAATFAPDNSTLLQKTFEVVPLMFGTNFEVNQLEISFVSDQMKRGSNDFSEQFAFMNFFYDQLARRVNELMEIITWTGTVAANGVDGLEVKFAADVNVLVPTAGNGGIASAVDKTNVIAKMTQARNVVPKAIRKRSDFVYIVSQNVYDALADSISENKASGLYYLEGETIRFQGREVYLADGASDNTIVATYWDNLLSIQDLQSEELGFNVVDFMKTILNRVIGVRVDFKFQPDYVNAEEIYFHTFA